MDGFDPREEQSDDEEGESLQLDYEARLRFELNINTMEEDSEDED